MAAFRSDLSSSASGWLNQEKDPWPQTGKADRKGRRKKISCGGLLHRKNSLANGEDNLFTRHVAGRKFLCLHSGLTYRRMQRVAEDKNFWPQMEN
jgi:hypothetical protein